MKKKHLKCWMSAIVLVIAAVSFGDGVFAFQQGTAVSGSSNPNNYNATYDTFLNQPGPNNNYAGYEDLYIRGDRDESLQTSIIMQFANIQNWLDTGFGVTSARVKLTLVADAGSNTTIYVSRVLREWTETGATFNATGTGVNWTEGGAWSTTGETPDRAASMTSVDIPSTALAGDSFWFDVDAAVVQDWIDTPSSNYGLLFYIDNGSGDNFRFWSKETSPTISLRPVLEITGSVPEPITASLLGIGGLFVALRRKNKEHLS